MGSSHKSVAEGALRIKAVERLLDRGYSPALIAQQPHPISKGRKLGTVKTIVADIKSIRKARLAVDPDYFTRTRLAISEATATYKRVMEDMEMAIEAARRSEEPNYHAINSMLMQKAKVTELWLEANILYDPDKLLTEAIGTQMYAIIKQVQKANGINTRGSGAADRRSTRPKLPGTP